VYVNYWLSQVIHSLVNPINTKNMITIHRSIEANELQELSDEQLQHTMGGNPFIDAFIEWLNREMDYNF